MVNFSMGNSFNPHNIKTTLNKQNSRDIWYDENNVNNDSNNFLLENNKFISHLSKRKVLKKENRKYNQALKKIGR